MGKGGFHTVDADGHVLDMAERVVPHVDEPFRERAERLMEWKRRNSSGGHLAAAQLPYSELSQGYERTGRRLLGTRDIADNLDPQFVEVGKMGFLHPNRREGSGYDAQVTREDLTNETAKIAAGVGAKFFYRVLAQHAIALKLRLREKLIGRALVREGFALLKVFVNVARFIAIAGWLYVDNYAVGHLLPNNFPPTARVYPVLR